MFDSSVLLELNYNNYSVISLLTLSQTHSNYFQMQQSQFLLYIRKMKKIHLQVKALLTLVYFQSTLHGRFSIKF